MDEVDGAANDDGFIYCIAEYDRGRKTGYFKVGTAKNPEKRLRDLQTGNVRKLDIWLQSQEISSRLTVETRAHQALSRYAVNLGGGNEWFMASTDSEQRDFENRFFRAVS